MSTKNLWGDLPQSETTVTPAAILREQAAILSKMTNGLLTGDVSTEETGGYNREGDFVCTFNIVAPGLSHYTYEVLKIVYPIGLFPAHVRSSGEVKSVRCEDETELKERIADVLQSDRIQGVLSKLLSHVRAESQPH